MISSNIARNLTLVPVDPKLKPPREGKAIKNTDKGTKTVRKKLTKPCSCVPIASKPYPTARNKNL